MNHGSQFHAQRPAPETAATVDVTKLGPQAGEKAPDFSLSDQHGTMRTLDSLMGPNRQSLPLSWTITLKPPDTERAKPTGGAAGALGG